MVRSFRSFPTRLVLALAAWLAVPAALEAAWPEIPKSEWALTEVEEYPNAPAVVLWEEGTLSIDAGARSSYMEVYRRVKVLNEEGVAYGSISILGNRFFRMKDLEGRTLQPDGRVVPLPKDAQFKKDFSLYYRATVHTFAMPEVQVGSIVEYRYRIFFDTVLYTEPWYFQSELPALHSEVTLEFPKVYGFQPFVATTVNRPLHQDQQGIPDGYRLIYALEDLPPISDEPYRFPFHDLASRAIFLPTAYAPLGGGLIDLLKDTKSFVDLYQDFYKDFRSKDGATKRKGKELAGGKAPRQGAEAIYRFVRDEIVTEPYEGITVRKDSTCDKVLKSGRGDFAEKALLLQAMLKAAKVDSSLGWTNRRDDGRINQDVPDPHQFGMLLVVATLDGEEVFLDPGSANLAFGRINPALEGVSCLLVDEKKPRWVTTPVTPHGASARAVDLTLRLDGEGVISGTGRMKLTGHHAWYRIDWKESAEKTHDAWLDWLEERYPGFAVTEVTVEEDVETTHVGVSWALRQRQEEVLGDEAELAPAAPLGLAQNPFSLPPERRRTPVMLPFADSELVHLELEWGEGWTVDAEPKLRDVKNVAGELATDLAIDPEARRLVAERRLDVTDFVHFGPDRYRALHHLYVTALANDAERLVFVRE